MCLYVSSELPLVLVASAYCLPSVSRVFVRRLGSPRINPLNPDQLEAGRKLRVRLSSFFCRKEAYYSCLPAADSNVEDQVALVLIDICDR